MSSFSTSEIIEIVFIPLYFVLLLACLYSLLRHGSGKKAAYGLLFIFPLIRLVGNILLVVATEISKKATTDDIDTLRSLYTAGYILQLAGYGLLVSAALALTNRAILHDPKAKKEAHSSGLIGGLLQSPSRLLHLINTVGTILLIVGLSSSTSAFAPSNDPTASPPTIATTAKVGAILLLIATVLLFLLTGYHLLVAGPVTPSARLLLSFVLAACLPMLARAVWSVYRVLSNKLVGANVWAQLVLQYVCEVIAVAILVALSFVLDTRGGDHDLDERKSYNDRLEQSNQHHTPQQGVALQCPQQNYGGSFATPYQADYSPSHERTDGKYEAA